MIFGKEVAGFGMKFEIFGFLVWMHVQRRLSRVRCSRSTVSCLRRVLRYCTPQGLFSIFRNVYDHEGT